MKCEQEIKDIIIVGGGPAAITSAIYAARMKRCVWMLYEVLAGQASLTSNIENYTGFRMISGSDFTDTLQDHLDDYDLQPMKEKVLEVRKNDGLFEVKTGGNLYKSKAVIVASGARHRELGVPGEKEFLGHGVAYCVICDAPFFRNKDVAVVGGGNSALTTALELVKYASRIYLLSKNEGLMGEQTLIQAVKVSEKIEFVPSAKILKITGDKFVNGIEFEVKGTAKNLEVRGVFIEIGYIPNSEIIDVKKNNRNEIIINERNETSEEGLFAAGDVTNIEIKQIVVAAGEGAKAALAASQYLDRIGGGYGH
ncbi:NAD(P)/FAD-dependent oxidoreductase [Dehalogenimonas etheniformans]|uniref:NAD(P)/FAD-dependent oxidoreductase n=1 Tax=Dehalogenimonas etheniformans TaxID=1536648 RepID=UPI001392271C|nr:FAD-dependent oxidoreductase [Dehalogenimonas etheniformans]QNT76946.1 FAD-dependent oxidoreductase [Dehalogenimonas etheniformans]